MKNIDQILEQLSGEVTFHEEKACDENEQGDTERENWHRGACFGLTYAIELLKKQTKND